MLPVAQEVIFSDLICCTFSQLSPIRGKTAANNREAYCIPKLQAIALGARLFHLYFCIKLGLIQKCHKKVFVVGAQFIAPLTGSLNRAPTNIFL
jgi:hypothetical protein